MYILISIINWSNNYNSSKQLIPTLNNKYLELSSSEINYPTIQLFRKLDESFYSFLKELFSHRLLTKLWQCSSFKS